MPAETSWAQPEPRPQFDDIAERNRQYAREAEIANAKHDLMVQRRVRRMRGLFGPDVVSEIPGTVASGEAADSAQGAVERAAGFFGLPPSNAPWYGNRKAYQLGYHSPVPARIIAVGVLLLAAYFVGQLLLGAGWGIELAIMAILTRVPAAYPLVALLIQLLMLEQLLRPMQTINQLQRGGVWAAILELIVKLGVLVWFYWKQIRGVFGRLLPRFKELLSRLLGRSSLLSRVAGPAAVTAAVVVVTVIVAGRPAADGTRHRGEVVPSLQEHDAADAPTEQLDDGRPGSRVSGGPDGAPELKTKTISVTPPLEVEESHSNPTSATQGRTESDGIATAEKEQREWKEHEQHGEGAESKDSYGSVVEDSSSHDAPADAY